MRWNKRERLVGELAAVAVFLTGCLIDGGPGAASRLRPGMSSAQVMLALGTEGRPHPTKIDFSSITIKPPSSDPVQAARQKGVVDDFFRNKKHYRLYTLPFESIDVQYRGSGDEERIEAAESYRTAVVFDWNWRFVVWAGAGCVVGLGVAEFARRTRRPAAAT